VKTHPTPENFLDLSLRYYQAGEFTKCIGAAEEALKLKPDYGLAYNNICAAYNELKQWDKAIEAGEKAVRLIPNNALANNNLAWAKAKKVSLEKTKVPQNQ
jgi:tetratricopeptide (TPR) repeat protein